MRALVITVRGFHAGYLGCYGNEWITTPALDRLAAGGVVFDQHLADVPDAAAARRAWRDGRHHLPPIDGAGDDGAPAADLLDGLRRRGVRTVLVADGSRPSPEAFAAGWDDVEVVRELRGEATFLEQTVEAARSALARLAGAGEWLLWVDLAALLPPWDVPAEFSDPYFENDEDEYGGEVEDDSPPDEEDEEEVGPGEAAEGPEEEIEEERFEEEYVDEGPEGGEGELLSEPPPEDEEEPEDDPLVPWFDPPPGPIETGDDIDFARLQSSYAAAVSFADAGVDALLEELARLGRADECLVVLTSDHGQALGEHGIAGPHRPWLHEELVHLPLLLRLPPALAAGREGKGLRVGALTQSADLAATLLDAFGAPPPDGAHGHSLLPLAREEVDAVRPYACCGLRSGAAAEWCLRTPEWSFLMPAPAPGDAPRGPQLYARPDDRWEVNDVLQHHPERAELFEQALKQYVAATRGPGPFDPPPLSPPAAIDP